MTDEKGRKHRDAWNCWLIGFGAVTLGVLAVASMGIGPVAIPVAEVFEWVMNPSSPELDQATKIILYELRLPRVLGAVWIGAALAFAGVGFQSLFRNPLADPYIIGASSGAALGVSLAIVISLPWTLSDILPATFDVKPTTLFAMSGSLIAVSLVFAVGSINRASSTITLLLAGVAISSMTNALVSLIMFLHDQKAIAILSWLMGSLGGCDWKSLIPMMVVGSLGMVWIWCMARQLDAFSLGDIAAQSLGLHVVRMRCFVVIAASLATAAAVANAGIIGFVGLIAPQIARLLVGAKHTYLIPMSGILGSLTLVLADAIARIIVAPAELPIGIITALLGCPFFITLLLSRSQFAKLIHRSRG